MNKPFRGTIENWSVLRYRDAEAITGVITCLDDEERWGQGFYPERTTTITTSRIVKREKDRVETLNSVYALGKPFSCPE